MNRMGFAGELVPSRYVIGAEWILKSFIRKLGCLTHHLASVHRSFEADGEYIAYLFIYLTRGR